MSNKSERAVSAGILLDVLKNKAYSSIAISNALNAKKNLEKRERAFITDMINGTLRNLMYIDYVIERFSNVPFNKIKPAALNILRQSVYELIFMDTPQYAVCSEGVKLARQMGLSGLSGYVNGVLRNIARHEGRIPLPDEKHMPIAHLSIAYSHPEWLVKKWVGYYGYDFVKQMLEKNNEPPCVSICVNTIKTDAESLSEKLENEGVNVMRPHQIYAENALIIKGAGSIKDLSSYKEGLFHVQDTASQISVSALAPQKGETIFDMCASPGGKSFYAAYLMKNNGVIYAGDIHRHKIKLINDGIKRLGVNIVTAEMRDASTVTGRLIGKADRVIVDVPCTGFGIIRKKPDIKLNRKEEDINSLQNVQRSIMSSGAQYVKKGGLLLYSTCTITNEENIDNIKWFLDNFDFCPEMSNIPSILKNDINDGCLNLFPHIHGTDGFFISIMKKRG